MKSGRLSFVVVLLPLWISCRAAVTSTDGNTSWYRDCASDDDCGNLSCRCGICTKSCTTDDACPGNRCGAASCGGASSAAGICLPESPETADAAKPARTVDGASPPPSSPQGDAGTGSHDAGHAPAPPPASLPRGDAGAVTDCGALTDPLGGVGPAISFRNDLLPIFGLSCVASDCHGVSDHKAGLNLGHRCNYDANAEWKCTFPAGGDPNDSFTPQADDEQTVQAIYASLVAPSFTAPAMARVTPSDPENSFLVLKLANQQNARGLLCMNQDTSRDTTPCGGPMPTSGDPFCSGTAAPSYDAILAWIAQGAQNN